jgi:isoleucyl-tRNA synthetase
VLSTLLFDKSAIKNIIVSGLILAEDGKKMSKRLKNYPAPEYVMENYGADSLRMYLIDSPVVRAEEMKFSENGIKEILKSVIIPFWNAYNFFVEYAITDNWDPKTDFEKTSNNELDRWILSVMQSLIKEVNLQMESYNLYKVVPIVVDFIEELTNWYIRRSRVRFWAPSEENPRSKRECHSTLYTVLLDFSKVIAPILPFLSEAIYQNLAGENVKDAPESVHLCSYPMVDESLIDIALEERMGLVRTVVSIGNALRAKHNLKNRQPLSGITVVMTRVQKEKAAPYEHLIKEELNIKSIQWLENAGDLVKMTVKPNYRLLGKKFGARMKEAAAAIGTLSSESAACLEKGKCVAILGQEVTPEEVVIERVSEKGTALETKNGITVGLNTEISGELYLEGLAQEFKNRVNTFRKESGLDKEERIHLYFETASPRIREAALKRFHGFIKAETLALSLEAGIKQGVPLKKEAEIDGENITIAIERIKR